MFLFGFYSFSSTSRYFIYDVFFSDDTTGVADVVASG